MNKKYTHLTIGLIFIALSMYYAFRGVKFSDLSDALISVRYIYLIPTIIIVLVSYILRAVRWRYLIRPIKDVKTMSILSPLMVGFMANMLPARAGEFIRAYLLSKKERISFSSSFATIFIERLFDLIMLLLMIMWILIFMPESLVPRNGGTYQIADKVKFFGVLSFTLCVSIILFSGFLQFKNGLAMRIVGVFIRPFPHRWREKIEGMVHSFTEGLNIIRDRKGFLATILLSFLIWGAFVITYYPLYMAFGIENELPAVSVIVLCLTVAVFITIAPTPGFLGSYHLACVAALHGIYGIQKAVALSYGIVAWLVAMGTTVVIGAIFALKEHISFGEITTKEDQL